MRTSSTSNDPATLVTEWLGPQGRKDPYPFFEKLHEHGPVIGLPGGAVLVVGHAEAEAVLRDSRFIVEDGTVNDTVAPGWRFHESRRILNGSMLFLNGAEHRRMRRLVERSFTARRIDAMRTAVAQRVIALSEQLARHRDVVDFVEHFAYLLPVNVIADLLGVPEEDRGLFRGPVADLARALDPGWIHADLASADAAAGELAAYFGNLFRDRAENPRDDLLSGMLRARPADSPGHGNDDLVANAVLLLLAGFETTIGLLGNGLCVLFKRPDIMRRLRASPAESGNFVAEVLRYDTPVQLTGRRAADDVRLGDEKICAGATVIVALGAANRDPRRFGEPHDFLLGRPGASTLSFGSGRHFCLGARLARLEGEVAFSLLPRLLPELRLSGTPVRLARTNLRGFAQLPVTAHAGGREMTCPR